jgi:hypothetical protein
MILRMELEKNRKRGKSVPWCPGIDIGLGVDSENGEAGGKIGKKGNGASEEHRITSLDEGKGSENFS